MPRFTLSQLFMGIALIAIALAFTQTEGCGRRFAMIESISFSSDDSRIVVTKLNARDARTPMKIYKANVSRTVSWLDVSTGKTGGVIHQDFKAGNCGPAFRLWRVGRISALCNPSNDHVAMSAFGGGDITRYFDVAKPKVVSLKHPAFNLTYSRSGRFLAASGNCELTVLDTENDTVVMRIQANDDPFLGASLMSFTNDDTGIILAGDSGVHAWDIAAATQRSTVIQGREPWIRAIAVAPDDTLVVCSDECVRRYDIGGKAVATLADKGAYLCSIAGDGKRLAVAHDGHVTIYNLDANTALDSLPLGGTTALALSSNGNELAVGDYNGRVKLIDRGTGAQRWSSNPPGRHRWPWTLPGVFLVAWIYVAWRLSRRQKDC
jgi:WD40 repeat protein